MTIWNAILFGIIQGFTEFLPVSSGAHLSVLGNLFGLSDGSYNYQLFCIFLHFGTILSLVISFLSDFVKVAGDGSAMLSGKGKKRYPALRFAYLAVLGTLPLFFLLFTYSSFDRLYTNTFFIGGMMIISGILLEISDRFLPGKRDEKNATAVDALLVGVCQLAGIIPGISRVGVTYSAGRAAGFKKGFAIQYALLLSLPCSLGINIIHFAQELSASGIVWADLPSCLIGMAVSMVCGILAIRIVRVTAEKGEFHSFAYYNMVAGVLFIILTMIF